MVPPLPLTDMGSNLKQEFLLLKLMIRLPIVSSKRDSEHQAESLTVWWILLCCSESKELLKASQDLFRHRTEHMGVETGGRLQGYVREVHPQPPLASLLPSISTLPVQ